MTQSVWNTIACRSGLREARFVFTILFLTLVAVASPTTVRARNEPSGPFLLSASTQTANDIQIEARVRRALRQDAQLHALNLGVQMRGGVVSLSGPIPTAELKQRAVRIVQQVEGVLSVSAKDIYISSSDPKAKRLSVLIPNDRPTRTRSASPGLLPYGLGPSEAPSPGGTGQQITLLAPESAAPPARVPEAARLTANPHPEPQSVALSSAVEQLRLRNSRYQQLHTRVQDSTVYIQAGEAASEDVMLFAQAVRRLAGVQRVIITSSR